METELYEELVKIRHQLHAQAELSNQEFRTTEFLKSHILSLGIEILKSDLPTGFVAKMGSGSPVVALRTDIDALPITEQTDLPFKSQTEGVMHACGHDFHMASLLGAARLLKEREKEIKGTIKLIFQPAEEIGQGANEVIGTGLINDVQAFIGYHNIPKLGKAIIGLREKGVMAAVDRFSVCLRGETSHAAYPDKGKDVIVALTSIIQNLQTIVSRNIAAQESVVLSVTHIEAGKTWNVLPETAFFEGTIRSYDEEVRAKVKQRFQDIIENIAKAFDIKASINWPMEAAVTYNDPTLTQLLFEATKSWHEATIVQEVSSVGEDFANYRTIAPSVLAFIGSNQPESPDLHQADMTVEDDVLPVAVDYFVRSAFTLLDYLKKNKKEDK